MNSEWGQIYKSLGATPIINAIGSVTMLGGSTPVPEVKDIQDAKSVAKKYSFEHLVLDYQEKFFDGVINNFVDSYSIGETPLPCVPLKDLTTIGNPIFFDT